MYFPSNVTTTVLILIVGLFGFFIHNCSGFIASMSSWMGHYDCFCRGRPAMVTNQSHFYSTNIPGVVRLSGATSKSVLNSKIDEAVPERQQVIGHVGVYGGKARSKRYILIHFLKVATEVDERTDTGKLFQREWDTRAKLFFPRIGLDSRYRQSDSFIWSQWTWWK